MKNKQDGKLILYLSLFSPLIDIITSIMLNNGVNFTLGIFVKCIMLVLMAIYLVFRDKKNWKKNIIFILIIGIFNVLSVINNISILNGATFSYLSFLIKFDFSLLSLYYFIRYFLENKIDIKLLKIPIFILVSSIVISNLTGTGFYTYDAHRLGNSGWFSSGNEFGALLSILYPIAIYLFLDRKDSKKIDIIYVLALAFGMINLGTKVGLLSFYISSLAYLFFRIINYKKYKLNYSFYVMTLLVIIVSCLFNYLPTTINVIKRYDYVANNSTNVQGEAGKVDVTSQIILSNRDQYLDYVMSNEYNLADYLFGKINFNGESIVIIEMDLFDIFYMFGIVGFILWYGLIGYIGFKVLFKYIKNMSNGIRYIKINMLIICVILTFAISCLVGHMVLCPSVSLYFSLICAYLFAYDKFEKEENDKVKILIGAVHMKTGGIEKTLVNLLNAIDYDKYEVDLLLQLENGVFYTSIPNEVKIITPYPKWLSKFFAKESKVSKIIKHILYNKYTAWFWTNNKMYDVAIDYAGYYLFITYYVIRTMAKKKFIWVHQNVYGSLKYSSNFEKNFIKNRDKYKYFDKIVCVSKSSKKDFQKMFVEYANKTVVVYNRQDVDIKMKDKINLDGEFVIVSVGRLCVQKGFDRLILVHKKLIQTGYKVKTYIIGGGEEYSSLKKIINDNGVSDTFILLGSQSNVYDYLNAADLFVSSSYTEAFSTVLFEALMCNLPWVGPKVGGVSDIAEFSPNGSYKLTEDSVDGIYEGIITFIDKKNKQEFVFNVNKYNHNALKQFYRLIGD